MRSYEAARTLFSFLGFLAWSVITIGIIVAMVAAGGVSSYYGAGAALISMAPGIGIALAGFILVAFVQMGRATVDTAEYTQQMLKISRDQLQVSKQSLKTQNTAPQTFAASAQKEVDQNPKSSFATQVVKLQRLSKRSKLLNRRCRLKKAPSTRGKQSGLSRANTYMVGSRSQRCSLLKIT